MKLQLRKDTLPLFKGALEVLSDLSSKAVFSFSSKGLELQALDASRVALGKFFLPAEFFENYYCDHDILVESNVVEMAKVFRCTNDNDSVTIKAVDNGFDVITFTFVLSEGADFYISLDFNVVGPTIKFPEIPEILESDYEAVVIMPSANLMRICKRLRSFARGDNDVTIIVDKDKQEVYFYTLSEMGLSRIDITPEVPTRIELNENAIVTLDLKYMNFLSKAPTLPHDDVTIRISTKVPTMFEYKITQNGYIRYYVAAKEDEMHNEEGEMQMTSNDA